MATKLYDLVVKTGEYTSNGETKGRYENVGSIMQGDNGQFMILKRTFNPAGVANPENKDSIIVSCFEPKDQNQQAPQQQGYAQQAPQQAPAQPAYGQQAPNQYAQAQQQPQGAPQGNFPQGQHP